MKIMTVDKVNIEQEHICCAIGNDKRNRASAQVKKDWIKKEFDNFGLLVDLSHLPLLRETPEECIEALKEHIVHAHVGNCVVKNPELPGYGDLHPRFGFPDSENDVNAMVRFLRALLNIGFLNSDNPPVLSFEVKPFGDEDPEIVIANAKRVLNEAWARV